MTHRWRVLQVITGLKPGGAERLLLNLAAAMDTKRFQVGLVSLSQDLEAIGAYGFANTEVKVFDFARDRLRNLSAFANLIEKFEPHVIHAHMFHALMATLAAKSLARCRPAICFTGHRSAHALWRQTLIGASRKMRDVDVLLSEDGRSAVDAIRAVVIPNGVTVPKSSPRRNPWSFDSPLRVLSVGRLIDIKDCLGLVRSFAAAAVPNAVLEFVGAGPLENEIRRLATDLHLASRVVVSGFCTDVRERMQTAHVFAMHSRQEGMPMALLEAGAEAMPVIATPVGAIPTILGTDRGVLVGADAFPEALRRLLAESEKALAMGRRLRAHVEARYSITGLVRAHEELYCQLATETGHVG